MPIASRRSPGRKQVTGADPILAANAPEFLPTSIAVSAVSSVSSSDGVALQHSGAAADQLGVSLTAAVGLAVPQLDIPAVAGAGPSTPSTGAERPFSYSYALSRHPSVEGQSQSQSFSDSDSQSSGPPSPAARSRSGGERMQGCRSGSKGSSASPLKPSPVAHSRSNSSSESTATHRRSASNTGAPVSNKTQSK